jgi:drug/metabolite transporter (DMT)-like permease
LGVAYVLLAIAPLCWAGNHIMGRAIAGEVPPGGLSVLRWLLAALILLPFATGHLRRDWAALGRKPWTVALLAVAGGGIFGMLQFIALQHTVAFNAAVFNSTVPAFIIVAGGVIFRDPVRLLQVLGILISLLGVLSIVAKGDPQILFALQFNGGDVLLVANMALFAVYSACLRLRPQMHWMTFTIALSVVACLTSLPLAVLEVLDGDIMKPDVLTLSAVLYAGVCTSAIAYACWARGVEIIGAARAGVFLHLVPVYGAVLSTLILNEAIGPHHIIGLGLILTGVFLASRR